MPDELCELADAWLSGTLAERGRDRLEALLRDSAPRQRSFIAYVDLHAQLHWELRGGLKDSRDVDSTSFQQQAVEAEEEVLRDLHEMIRRDRLRSLPPTQKAGRWWAAAAVLLVGLGLAAWTYFGRTGTLGDGELAVLLRGSAMGWADTETAPKIGDPLGAGTLQLDAGFAEIKFRDGALVVLEAPARFEVLAPDRGYLHFGRLVALADAASVGFTLRTGSAEVVDLGTEFGVEVDLDGSTVVQVFDGEVLASIAADGGGLASNDRRRLTAGQALEIAGPERPEPRDVEFSEQRFVRRLPWPDERGAEPNRPFNEPRFQQVHVVPAPAGLAVDGDLSDWDLSGALISRCGRPFGENYYLEAAMMYDEARLYLGAHVGDPSPMHNAVSPRIDPAMAWQGGGLQVRLSVDRKLRWPLQAASRDGARLEGRELTPADANDKLVHLTLWYYEPQRLPCLLLEHGMDFRPSRVNPPGYEGAYRRDADGRGYTVEYAAPWQLLGAGDDPPRAGDRLAANWLAHWSDQTGRLWRGHLLDVVNPADMKKSGGRQWTFMRAATWGKAIYHRRGKLRPETVTSDGP